MLLYMGNRALVLKISFQYQTPCGEVKQILFTAEK